MKYNIAVAAVALACAAVSPAYAAPGLGGEVYSATVEKGETEFEARWDELDGGPDDGESVFMLEAAHGVTDKFLLALKGEFEKDPGSSREAEAMAVEAIYELGQLGGIDFALYGEYEIVFEGADKIETKLLLQRKSGPWDVRLNLIAEKELEDGEPLEFEYAASADVATVGELRLGIEAFGELGTSKNFLPNAEHFVGPSAKFEIEGLGPEIEIQAGYLFAIGKARDDADGQFRLGLEIEF